MTRSDLLELRNVGPAVAARFERIGIRTPSELRGLDAVELYERMQEAAGQPEDPCLLDTLLSAVDQANGGDARPWWSYTAERKRMLEGHSIGGA